MWARFIRWRKYRRELDRLINDRLDKGYRVHESHEVQFRAQARQVAGYPPPEPYYTGPGDKRW